MKYRLNEKFKLIKQKLKPIHIYLYHLYYLLHVLKSPLFWYTAANSAIPVYGGALVGMCASPLLRAKTVPRYALKESKEGLIVGAILDSAITGALTYVGWQTGNYSYLILDRIVTGIAGGYLGLYCSD
jgi:hypothetical protein